MESNDPLDREYIQENYTRFGCEELLRDVQNIFRETAPLRLDELRKALDKDDLDAARAVLHSLKGAAGSAAARIVREITMQAEKAVLSGNGSDARELLPILASETDRVFAAFDCNFPRREET